MPLDAGELRNRITIQQQKNIQDEVTGLMSTRWVDFATNVAAKITDVSVNTFVASQQMQSQVTARITIRYREGLSPTMRILHPAKNKIYNPAGWLADPDSGVEYVTAPCSEGVNAGD